MSICSHVIEPYLFYTLNHIVIMKNFSLNKWSLSGKYKVQRHVGTFKISQQMKYDISNSDGDTTAHNIEHTYWNMLSLYLGIHTIVVWYFW